MSQLPPASGSSGAPGSPPAPPLDMSRLNTTYANYFHAWGSTREVLIDFGFNSGLRTASGPEPVHVTQRIILPSQVARELLVFLQAVLQQQERGAATASGARPAAPRSEQPPASDRAASST